MKLTLDLPDDLLEEVQEITATTTPQGAVIAALESVVREHRKQRLIARLGTTQLNLTREDLREMRKGREPPPADAPLLLIGPSDGRHRLPPKHRLDEDEES